MKNCHYIPRLLLRHFSSKKEKICLFDKTKGVFSRDVKLDKSFAIPGYYPDEIEAEFNLRCELEFADLLNHVILGAKEKKLVLNRLQIQKIKKFMLLLIIRSAYTSEWLEQEKNFREIFTRVDAQYGIEKNLIFKFKEKTIAGESTEEYWIRSLKCILDSEYALPEEIERDENATEFAWRWAWTIRSGYLGFWSSRGTNVDFMVTDVGMTSENEVSIGTDITLNPTKLQTLINCIARLGDDPKFDKTKEQLAMIALRQTFFHENFMMFPTTKDLMIVLINPYFKALRELDFLRLPFVPIEALSSLNNKSAFVPNKSSQLVQGEYQNGDSFEYTIHNLTRDNCIYLNMLTLDRVNGLLGFSDPKKIISSLERYQSIPEKLADYSELIRQIKQEGKDV